jgi:hypothetical protein
VESNKRAERLNRTLKNWEETGLLTDLLDRHVERLTRIHQSSDWTVFLHLAPFLELVRQEPVLAALVDDYVREFAAAQADAQRVAGQILEQTEKLFVAHELSLNAVRERIEPGRRDGLGLDRLPELVAEAKERLGDDESLARVLDCLHRWIEFDYDAVADRWGSPTLEAASVESAKRRNISKRASLRMERLAVAHPGAAYVRLINSVQKLDWVVTDEPAIDDLRNKNVAKLYDWIRDGAEWGDSVERLPQPAITEIQRDIRTLQLALVTSLAKGRSRRATMERFAARCESFDRERLLQDLAGAKKPEAVLTLAFARYLFDAGFNPLVDAAACGLRPDILDATADPAFYVEAKQYEKIGNGFAGKLKEDIAQTLNTWGRLAKRWSLPEAFVLIFRRSGRPVELDRTELRVRGRRLYVCCVDLAPPDESGSRSKEPVHVQVGDLLKA